MYIIQNKVLYLHYIKKKNKNMETEFNLLLLVTGVTVVTVISFIVTILIASFLDRKQLDKEFKHLEK